MTSKIQIVVDSDIVENPTVKLSKEDFDKEVDLINKSILEAEIAINLKSKVRFHFQNVKISQINKPKYEFVPIGEEDPLGEFISFENGFMLKRSIDPDAPCEKWTLFTRIVPKGRTVYNGSTVPDDKIQDLIELVITGEVIPFKEKESISFYDVADEDDVYVIKHIRSLIENECEIDKNVNGITTNLTIAELLLEAPGFLPNSSEVDKGGMIFIGAIPVGGKKLIKLLLDRKMKKDDNRILYSNGKELTINDYKK